VDGESLDAGDPVDVWGKLRRRLGRNLDRRDLPAEGAGTERAGVAAGPACRQDVVGAGDVIAEGRGSLEAEEDAACRPDPAGEQRSVLLDELEVLGGVGVREIDRRLGIGHLNQGEGRVGNARA
jgi:hypothetical protein